MAKLDAMRKEQALRLALGFVLNVTGGVLIYRYFWQDGIMTANKEFADRAPEAYIQLADAVSASKEES